MSRKTKRPLEQALQTQPKPAPARTEETRWDGYISQPAGFGVTGRDKRLGFSWLTDEITPEEAQQIWRGSDLGSRIIELPVDEEFRQGWELQIADQDEPTTLEAGDVTPPDVENPRSDAFGLLGIDGAGMAKKSEPPTLPDSGDLQEDVTAYLNELGLEEAFRTARYFERAYGGSGVMLGVNDGQKLDQPLDLDRVISLDFLTVLEPRELKPLYYYTDPAQKKFGQVMIWQISVTAPGGAAPGSNGTQVTLVSEIHETRLVIFGGHRVTRRNITALAGWGDSVLVQVNPVLRDFSITWGAAGVLMTEFATPVMLLEGYGAATATDKRQMLKNRLEATLLAKSTVNALILDAKEKFERQVTPVAGLADLLDRFMVRLASAARIPVTKLAGQSPAGLNATGDADVRNFYDEVKSSQVRRLRPAFERVIKIVFRVLGVDEPTTWSVIFKPLWQPTELEQAQARLTQAQVDQIYLQNGVVSAEEIAVNRFSADEYSFHTHIDFKQRKELSAAAPKPIGFPGKDPNVEPPPPPPTVVDEKGNAVVGKPTIPKAGAKAAE